MADQDHEADEPEDAYPLAPSGELPPRPDPSPPPGVRWEPAGGEESEPERFQFSLSELLWLVAAFSFLLSFMSSVIRFLPGSMKAETFAGMMGFGTLLCLIVMAVFPSERRIVQVGWWTLAVLYLLACVMALIQGR